MIRQNFNAGWTVEKCTGNPLASSFLGQSRAKPVHLPYDAMIHEERSPDTPNGAQTGFYPGGEYIFEKKFIAPESWRGRPVFLSFEGVYQLATVTINRFQVCRNVNGYAEFTAELTPYLNYGGENLIRVMADNSLMPNSRWYTGSGIYRPVHLLVGSKVYLPHDTVRITTREACAEFALLEGAAQLQSASTCTEQVTVEQTICREGQPVLTDRQNVLLRPGEAQNISFRYCLEAPALWSPEKPNLYTSTVRVLDGKTELDREETTFGIRTLTIDAAHGVRINGQTVKLRGACIHHDNGILGAATLAAAEERRIRQLKEAGFNAIRSSHHPAGRALLDACDRYGVLVMDELSDVWNVRKNPYDYALYFAQDWKPTLEKMVAKDYNHPSVILYCVGNEISEAGSESGAAINRQLCNTLRMLDSTRYTTNALNGLMAAGFRLRDIMKDVLQKFPAQPDKKGGDGAGSNALNSFMSLMAGEKGDYFATHPLLTEALSGCEDSCDVIGLNYLTGRHVLEHELHPHKAVLGTETYPADIVRLWRIVEENPHMIGDFTWAGYDYLGEAGCGIFHYDGGKNFSSIYPERTAYIGDLDLLGNRRPISYLREIVYGLRKAPYLAVLRMEHNGQTPSKTPWMFKDNLASWTWPGFEGQEALVDVYSASEEVELFLNGTSLGRRQVTDFTVTYAVPYAPGELKAVGYTGGTCDGECTLCTARDAHLTLTADRTTLHADGEDAAFVMIHFVDAAGNEDLHTVHTLQVTLEGAAVLEAVGSANPSSEERYDAPESKTYDGCCMAVLRTGETAGPICLTVTADGQETKTLQLQAE